MELLSERSAYAENAIQEEDSAAEALQRQGHHIIKLNRGDPAVYFPTTRYVVNAYVKALKQGRTGYSMPRGVPELREAVSRRYKRMYNADIDSDNILVSNGVSEALLFLNAMLIDKGDRAVLFRPYYSIYMPDLMMSEGSAIIERYEERSNWEVDTDSLRRSIKENLANRRKIKYMMLTNPNNPTGTVLARNTLEEIVEIAKDNEILLISDEIYDEVVYNGAKFTSMAELAKGIPHIILNGASKDFDATGFRIGFVIIPENDKTSKELNSKLLDFAKMRLSANTPAQYAMAAGINNVSAHKKALGKMVKAIESRSSYATKIVNESGFMDAVEPNSAYYLFPKLRMDRLRIKDDKEFVAKLLHEEGVQLTRGSGFGEPDHVRIVVLPPEKILEVALTRIIKFCERHKR